MKKDEQLMEKLVSLCKRRGFIFPGSEIYGGLANSWDYGPLGSQLKKNIKDAWWKRFVESRDDVVGIDGALMMNSKVWEASGHIETFNDPMVDCKKCKERFRAEGPEGAERVEGKCSKGGQHEFTTAKQFNLMFKTYMGPVEDEKNIVYLRPETAQAMFVDFKNVLQTTRKKIPFGIAQQGHAFRNEITPGNFIFRTREFEQMEIEYFVHEKDWKKYFEMWLKEMEDWLKFLGVQKSEYVVQEIPKKDLAHYSKRTVDIEYKFPFGTKELYGLAYRTDFDLQNHAKKSGEDLSFEDPISKEKYIPHVVEPTWGLNRSVLVALLSAYHEEDVKGETRVVLKIPKEIAPYQIAVLPLSKKEELSKVSKKVANDLRKQFIVEYDETQSIGKRYRRQDEIGTPFCVTVDFDSLDDKAVTVRDRDSMKQERVKISEVGEYLRKKFE